MTRRRLLLLLALLLVAGSLLWLCRSAPDPRQLVLGDWKESTNRLYVEVTPGLATARGMAHGSVAYEWVQTEKEPYTLKCTYRQDTFEVQVSFPSDDVAVVEPRVWHLIPPSHQRLIREFNRRNKRPEEELRLVFRRRPQKVAH